ncbi:MAG: prepilin-type N-terminal cleavage/methylation domain-containing protein [Candidatus Omnitrophota bacterium]|nr:prepilin-type N-terminal cleavage/methylation domain-containing protein [Candidatus Omnitrophota bacterium]
MAKRKAFSLAEIMIAVSIIVLLAAIAIPNLYRAKINSNESAAIMSIRSISTAAQTYRVDRGRFPLNLTSLGPVGGGEAGGAVAYCAAIAQPAYLDAKLGCAQQPCWKDGFAFSLTGDINGFSAFGTPNAGCGSRFVTGYRGFFVDESGVIRWTNQGCPMQADKTSPELIR